MSGLVVAVLQRQPLWFLGGWSLGFIGRCPMLCDCALSGRHSVIDRLRPERPKSQSDGHRPSKQRASPTSAFHTNSSKHPPLLKLIYNLGTDRVLPETSF